MTQQRRRPVTQRDTQLSPAPEKVDEGARTRDADETARRLLVDAQVITEGEAEEVAARAKPRVRQIEGGEVHWFTGGGLARETR